MLRRLIWWLADKLTPLECETVVFRTRISPGYTRLMDLDVQKPDGTWKNIYDATDPAKVKRYIKNGSHSGYKIITKRVPVATRYELTGHRHNGHIEHQTL